MLISLSKRFVFISNSKTASTSFEQVLDAYAEIRARGGPVNKHTTWLETRSAYAFLFDHPDHRPESFFRFGVIRDPLEWFVSWYNFRVAGKIKNKLPAGTTIEQYWRKDDWVKIRKDGSRHLQKSHFTDDDGTCSFDLVLPMDMLKEYEAALFARLGIEETLPVANKSPRILSSRDVAPALANEIREFWQEDYEFIDMMRTRVQRVLSAVVLSVAEVPAGMVADVRVQMVPPMGFAGMPLSLRGAVVCAPDTAGDARLFVRKGEQDFAVQWHLPSPAMANRFPDNPHAATARFQSEPVMINIGEGAALCLQVPGGDVQVIAVLETGEGA